MNARRRIRGNERGRAVVSEAIGISGWEDFLTTEGTE